MEEEQENVVQEENTPLEVTDENPNDLEKNEGVDEKKTRKKKKILLIIIGVLLFVVVILIVLWLFVLPNKKENSSVDYKKVLQEYGKLIEKNLFLDEQLLTYEEVTKMIDFKYKVDCQEHEVYQDGTLYLNNCSIDGKKVSTSYGQKVALEEKKPGAIKVYVDKGTNKATLTAPDNTDNYDVYDFDINERYANLELMCETCDYVFYLNNSNLGQMINYKTGEKALDGVTYDSILPIYYHNQNDDTFVAVRQTLEDDQNTNSRYKTRYWGIYNIRTGVAIIPFSLTEIYNVGGIDTKVLFHIYTFDEGVIIGSKQGEYALLNYRTGEAIIPFAQRFIHLEGDYIHSKEGLVEYVYDHYGNRKFTNYTVFTLLSKEYMFVQNKEGNVLFMNTSEEIIYDFGKQTVEGVYNDSSSDGRFSTKLYTHYDTNYQLAKCMQFDYYVDIGKGIFGVVNCDYNFSTLDPN